MTPDYINLPEGSPRGSVVTTTPGKHDYKQLAVVFGLLCFLQVALIVVLRVVDYNYAKSSDLDLIFKNQTSDLNKYFEQGWIYFPRSLYYISSVQKNYSDSRDFCVERGSDLVVVSSREEQKLINNFAKLIWIGLTKIKEEWVWVDGTPLTRSFWGPGEPNGFEQKPEFCVETRFHHLENSWNDIPCQDKNYWICEKEIV